MPLTVAYNKMVKMSVTEFLPTMKFGEFLFLLCEIRQIGLHQQNSSGENQVL